MMVEKGIRYVESDLPCIVRNAVYLGRPEITVHTSIVCQDTKHHQGTKWNFKEICILFFN